MDSLKDFKLTIDLLSLREVTIGRSVENTIVIPDPTVSRKHAILTVTQDGEIVIKDLGSTNGTYVFQESTFRKVNELKIEKEAIIRFGFYTIVKISVE